MKKPQNIKAQRIFISYRHVKPDEDLARVFETEFTRIGFQVFVDTNIKIGTDWAKEIDRQLQSADYFLVLLSEESILSDMVRQEIKRAHELKQQGKLCILPVRISFTGALPYDLGGYLNPLQYALWETDTPMQQMAIVVSEAICNSKALPLSAQEAEDSPEQIQALHDITEKTGAPLPVIDPRVLELAMERGSMACNSPYYIHRQADVEMEQQLSQKGFTVIVKGARQMGKSSLLIRAAAKAKAQGSRVCYIDFQRLDESQLASLDKLLLYLMHRLARDLKTTTKPMDYWDEYLGAKDSATDFVEAALLSGSQQKVVFLLDEVDRVFSYDYRNDFFALLRFWTNRRASSEKWEQFNLMIAHSTDPMLWIDDINQSPFNVGYPISLANFNDEQFKQLADRYRLNLNLEELQKIHQLIGGHPFLARKALYILTTDKISFDQLEDQAIRQDGPFGDHLRRKSRILSGQAAVAEPGSQARQYTTLCRYKAWAKWGVCLTCRT